MPPALSAWATYTLKPKQLAGFFDRGVKCVIVTAPIKGPATLNIVLGVNDHLYDPVQHDLLIAVSITPNCPAPVIKLVHEAK